MIQPDLEKILHDTLAQFHSETGTIHRLDTEKQLLYLVAQIGLPPQLLDIVKTIPVGKGIAGQTVAQAKPVSICNLQTDDSGVAKPGAKQTGVGGALSVPIWHDGRIAGTFGIGTRREHEYTEAETRALEEIGRRIGGWICKMGEIHDARRFNKPRSRWSSSAIEQPKGLSPAEVSAIAQQLIANVEKVIVGKHEQVVLAIAVFLAEGHLLIEDVPGVAKTMLARAIALSAGCTFKRIQCTPDLQPTDVLGEARLEPQTGRTEFTALARSFFHATRPGG